MRNIHDKGKTETSAKPARHVYELCPFETLPLLSLSLPPSFSAFRLSLGLSYGLPGIVNIEDKRGCECRSVDDVLNINGYSKDSPIIVLGAMGFVGKRLVRRLNGREIHSLDLHNYDSFPVSLKGTKTLLLNVSRKEVLRDYMKYFWKELIIFNEVYPPPHDTELTMIS